MQHFRCEKTLWPYAFEDDVVVAVVDGVYKFFTADEEELTAVPVTLKPCAPPDLQSAPAELGEQLRFQRNHALATTDWFVHRHRDEIDAESTTTLTAAEYKDLLSYRQALRDLTAQKKFPNVDLPKIPDSISLSVFGIDPENSNS